MEELTLKWGTLKGWKLETDKSKEILQRYSNEGVSLSSMLQEDTDNQKNFILELIDSVEENGGKFYLDWDGEYVTAEKAKAYVLEYGKRK